MQYRWARGLGLKAVHITVALTVVMLLLVGAAVWALRDTPPVNAAIHHDAGSGMDALLVGALVVNRDCIILRVDGESWVPIFPSDSVRLRHDALVYDGVEYRTGDEMSLGGGEVPTAPDGARMPKDCPAGPLWLATR